MSALKSLFDRLQRYVPRYFRVTVAIWQRRACRHKILKEVVVSRSHSPHFVLTRIRLNRQGHCDDHRVDNVLSSISNWISSEACWVWFQYSKRQQSTHELHRPSSMQYICRGYVILAYYISFLNTSLWPDQIPTVSVRSACSDPAVLRRVSCSLYPRCWSSQARQNSCTH